MISGYLMTGILLRQVGSDQFTLGGFFMRRIRRIVPALLFTMALSMMVAVPLLVPDLLENFGQSLFASALVANNVLLYLTGGYWDVLADFKPLMHTWSLAVEEQFYVICFPLMLWVLRRGGRSGLALGLTAAALASLALAQLLRSGPLADAMGTQSANADYLLLPTRLWQLGAGGLAQLIRIDREPAAHEARWSSLLAISAMLAPMALFDEKLAAPGIHTVIPVAGCMLYLIMANARDGAGRVLAGRLPVGIGLISYSAYLLHQPVFAFARLLSLAAPSRLFMAALIVPILIGAWLSWRFVEQPLRDWRRVSNRTILWLCGGGTLALAAAGLMLDLRHGIVHPWPELDGAPADNLAYVDSANVYKNTVLDSSQRDRNVLVIGHSFGRDFVNMGLAAKRVTPATVAYRFVDQCREALPAEWVVQPVATAVIVITPEPKTVPCIQHWVAQLNHAGIAHVVVLGSKSFGWSNSAVMRLPAATRYAVRVKPKSGMRETDTAALAQLEPGSFIDIFAMLDDGSGTVPVFTPDRRFISQDTMHLTPAGAQWLGPKLFAKPQLAHLPPVPR